MDFLPYLLKWLELTLRWGHVLFAILWVGNSFLFNYLDNNLNKSISSSSIDGEGYLMHSGYFYKLTRLKKSPPLNYLRSLIIFKWQSYLTFVTGILLLFVTYYYNSGILMVSKKVLEITPINAILISVLSLYFSWLVYDFLCKSAIIKNNKLFLIDFAQSSKISDIKKDIFLIEDDIEIIHNEGCSQYNSISIERLTSEKGYTKNNVVLSSFSLNSFKGMMSEIEFKQFLNEVIPKLIEYKDK